jgi:hypothetical protein
MDYKSSQSTHSQFAKFITKTKDKDLKNKASNFGIQAFIKTHQISKLRRAILLNYTHLVLNPLAHPPPILLEGRRAI